MRTPGPLFFLPRWDAIGCIELPDLDGEEDAETIGQLAEIAENLHRREIDALERNELMDQWRRLREDRKVHSAQLGPNEKSVREDGRGHRQPGGIRKAARDLGVSRQTLERATKVASLSHEAKTTARAVGLANNQTALLKAAAYTRSSMSTRSAAASFL